MTRLRVFGPPGKSAKRISPSDQLTPYGVDATVAVTRTGVPPTAGTLLNTPFCQNTTEWLSGENVGVVIPPAPTSVRARGSRSSIDRIHRRPFATYASFRPSGDNAST